MKVPKRTIRNFLDKFNVSKASLFLVFLFLIIFGVGFSLPSQADFLQATSVGQIIGDYLANPQVQHNQVMANLGTGSEIQPIAYGRYVEVDLSSQTLSMFENGTEIATYTVSTGRTGMETPTGTFSVMMKNPMQYSSSSNIYMPWFLQFTSQGHGIHELPEWADGTKEGANHLGVRVSHGCVRLGVGPAKTVYDFAYVGMPVVIHQ